MATAAALEKAIATNERYAENYRKAGKNPAKYVAKVAALKAELAALAPKPAATPGPVLTYDQEHAIFIAAEDELLKAAGKPFGHEGAERGALSLSTLTDLARQLNLPLHVAEFEGFVVPGASQ